VLDRLRWEPGEYCKIASNGDRCDDISLIVLRVE
jgi:hypothetical protein